MREKNNSLEKSKRRIEPSSLPKPGVYSQGIMKGPWLFVSGQVPVDEKGETCCYDITGQARRVFGNMGVVLQEAGGNYNDIVKLTTFLARKEDFPAFDAVRREFMSGGEFASTVVIIAELIRSDWLIEVEAIAYLDVGSES